MGFDTGSTANYTTTAEFLTVRHCRSGGIKNSNHSLTIRRLVTENISGPAIVNTHRDGFITLLEASLSVVVRLRL